jgi:protoporphyrin/coproporphyrin ferrochelatase
MMRDREGDRPAVLLMGYGSPAESADLPGYLADVTGRIPSPDLIREYERRYSLIGGSPQARILQSLRTKLEHRLAQDEERRAVYLGVKHWNPPISEVLPQIAAEGHRRIIAIPLSPYASAWILEPYRAALTKGVKAARTPLEVELRPGWNLEPHWIEYWAQAIRGKLAQLDPADSCVLLSAHSLPARFREKGDRYPEILDETCASIARNAGLDHWGFTYQSAGNTTEPWLGPDITEQMVVWRDRGFPTQLIASIGFVFDHLEVLYDLDIVVQAFAKEHGVDYYRVPMPNDSDLLVETLADVVRRPAGPVERIRIGTPSASFPSARP